MASATFVASTADASEAVLTATKLEATAKPIGIGRSYSMFLYGSRAAKPGWAVVSATPAA